MRSPRDGRLRHVLVVLALVATLTVPVLALGPAPPATAQPIGRSWVFTGGGWGHGVGMSQWSARAMAARGVNHEAIVGHFYRGASVTSVAELNDLRVLLGDTSQPVVLTPTSGLTISLNGVPVAQFDGTAPVQVRRVTTGFELTSPAGQQAALVTAGASDVLGVTWVGESPVRVSVTDKRYRYGSLAIRWNGTASLRVVVQGLTMQRYLHGVAEVPASWPTEALRVQAVAARTYAQRVATQRRASGEQFDLYATTLDQVYSGFEQDNAAGIQPWLAAVNSTHGRVITHDGALITAFYHASSGGFTENSENVFVTALPYLKGVPDPDDATGNSLHSWSRTYNEDEMAAWLNASPDTAVGRVNSIRVLGPAGVSGRLDKALVEITGSQGTKIVTGLRLTQVINAGAGPQLGRRALSTKWTVAALDVPKPIGSLDRVTRVPGGLAVSGWVIDPTTTAPVLARITVDGAGAAQGAADRHRADVGAAYPASGPDHGFDLMVPVAAGNRRVCLEGWGQGGISVLRCVNVVVSAAARGSLDSVGLVPGGLEVSGWAFDRDTAAPIAVHAYVDGAFAGGVVADRNRPDVGAAFPGYGPRHGFRFTVAVPRGARTVCLHALDATGNAPNQLIGCRSAARPASPIGNLDVATTVSGGIRVAGWAIDPDTTAAISVHTYVDGAFAGGRIATVTRSDVGAAFPAYGPGHGFDFTVAGSSGSNVCVYALSTAPGVNTLLGGSCRRVG